MSYQGRSASRLARRRQRDRLSARSVAVSSTSATAATGFAGSVALDTLWPALHESESELPAEVDKAIERCRVEIAAIEALLLAGHPDVEGLCLALSDWSGEMKLLEVERRQAACPKRRHTSA